MPVCLGHFYASLLLLVCLGINIAFFPEVREPFLGDEDPLASIKTSISELNFKARLAEICPGILLEAASESKISTPPPETPAKQPAEKRIVQKIAVQSEPAKAKEIDPFPDLSQLPAPSSNPLSVLTDPKDLNPEHFERKQPEKATPVKKKPVVNEVTRQTSAAVPLPQPAAPQSVIAKQFKPIVIRPKPFESAQPSTEAVWDTIDTVLERPLRYD